ncbi:MAG: type II toxin-antitoxin system RelE/ParE family toxin [Xanthomonadales bacterium]|nr:type II toxin-antitoxin system RelE/ParE family toxin [Xanthomonadales bacterium]
MIRSFKCADTERLAQDQRVRRFIRINDQYRLCFRWIDGGAEQVEIVDYH